MGACFDITGSYVGSFFGGIVILIICACLVAVALTQKKKIRAQWE